MSDGPSHRRSFPASFVITPVAIGAAITIALAHGRVVDAAIMAILFAYTLLRLGLWWKAGRPRVVERSGSRPDEREEADGQINTGG